MNSPKLSPLTLTKAKSQEMLCGATAFHLREDSLRHLFRWDEKRKLGSGAFATVYRATCANPITAESEILWGTGLLQPGKDYAVKVLPRDFLKRQCKHHKNLVHEVAILHHIAHPTCVRLHDVFDDPEQDSAVIVMELAEGGELLQMLQAHVKQGGCLTELEARNIVSQLLDALTYLQDQQIVHRDIKPENIIINPDTLQIKIIDFGFAKFIGHDAPVGMEDMAVASPLVMTPLGTLKYMAPEMLRVLSPAHDRSVRSRSEVQKLDMFALGIVTYLMLGGGHPFSCRSYNDLPELIEDGPAFPEEHFGLISHRARDFCLRLLNYLPEMRPTAKEAKLHPWFQFPIGAQGANRIVIKETRSSRALLDWMRDQSELKEGGTPVSGGRIWVKASPTSWSKAWGQRTAPISPKKAPASPQTVLKTLIASPGGNWADMSCEFDAFHSDSGVACPLPMALPKPNPLSSGSPPSQGFTVGHSDSEGGNWADMSWDQDAFLAPPGM